MRRLLPPLALLLAACPVEQGQQCPARTVAVGQYTLSFAGQHPANECAVQPSDGGTPVPVAVADGGQISATFCFGSGSDGGPQLSLIATGKQARYSDLLPDGGFHFASHTDAESGTVCGCVVSIDESFDGHLQSTPVGPIAIQPDGGLPLITAVAATNTDLLATDAGTTGCLCALPCQLTYGISGTRF